LALHKFKKWLFLTRGRKAKWYGAKKLSTNIQQIMANTSQQYDSIIARCRTLFNNKMQDYGSAWRILRLPSLTDQIFIKAQRIRSLQTNEIRKVDEDERSEFVGIINYAVMALIQLELGVVDQPDLDAQKAASLYDEKIATTKQLMEAKTTIMVKPGVRCASTRSPI
jgi:hypothetical protein